MKTPADAYNPSGMVMKAVLLNGTNPLGAPNWPNANSGWGRAWLDSNLWFQTTLAVVPSPRLMTHNLMMTNCGLMTPLDGVLNPGLLTPAGGGGCRGCGGRSQSE